MFAAAVRHNHANEHGRRQPNIEEFCADRATDPGVGNLKADVRDMDWPVRAEALVKKGPEEWDAEPSVGQGVQDAVGSRDEEKQEAERPKSYAEKPKGPRCRQNADCQREAE